MSLTPFRDPRSVAVVGASEDPAKWGHWLARGALTGLDRRAVHLVNRSGARVLGRSTLPALGDLPEPADLVVLAVPAAAVAGAVDTALATGTRAFLTVTTQVGEQATLRERLRRHGARMVGPNSLGLYDAATDLHLAWGSFTPGRLAVITQSGQLGSEIAILGARAGIGVSRFVSVGNQLDVTAADLLEDLADRDDTGVVALYLESFEDGERVVAAIRRLTASGVPTLLLTTGASDASRRLAQTHTGALTSTLDVVDAACRHAGAVRVGTPAELVDAATHLLLSRAPRGRRVAVVSDSGGQAGVAADVATARGLELPALPVDLDGAGEADLMTYADVAAVLAPGADAVLLSGYLGCYGADTPALLDAELAVVERLGDLARDRPVVVHTMAPGSVAAERMRALGIPVHDDVDRAVRSLARAADAASGPRPEVPAPAPRAAAPGSGYLAARAFLEAHGVRFPELEPAAPPYVLKAAHLAHKTEHDGVRVGVTDLATARAEMEARLGPGEYVAEAQDVRDHVVEVLVGARRDRDFGPVVTVGAGGTEAELLRDVRLELAPVDHATAVAMIGSLRCHALLAGWRGRPPCDVDALAEVVVALSEAVAADHRLLEIEVNPVRVGPDGALAVDALVVTLEEHP